MPVLLVFVDPSCPACTSLIPDALGWQHDHAAHLTVALLTEEPPDAAEIAFGVAPFRVTPEVTRLYGAYARPSAVLIAPDGKLAGPMLWGAGAIIGAVREFVPETSRPYSPLTVSRSHLGTPIPRRAALRAAVSLAGLFLLRGVLPDIALAKLAPRADSHDPNVNEAPTCQEFLQYLAATGVFDSDGVNHPGWAGVTGMQINPRYRYVLKPATRNAQGMVCVSATLTFTFTGKVHTDALRWRPASPSKGCTAAISAFDKRVDTHEAVHHRDAQQILARAEKRATRPIHSCNASEQEARSDVFQQMEDAAVARRDDFLRQYSDSIDRFHHTALGSPTDLKCPCDRCTDTGCPAGWFCSRGGVCCTDTYMCTADGATYHGPNALQQCYDRCGNGSDQSAACVREPFLCQDGSSTPGGSPRS